MRIGKLWMLYDTRLRLWVDGEGYLTKWGIAFGPLRVIMQK
jgi:hypothetical protein